VVTELAEETQRCMAAVESTQQTFGTQLRVVALRIFVLVVQPHRTGQLLLVVAAAAWHMKTVAMQVHQLLELMVHLLHHTCTTLVVARVVHNQPAVLVDYGVQVVRDQMEQQVHSHKVVLREPQVAVAAAAVTTAVVAAQWNATLVQVVVVRVGLIPRW
jgi:hypothetical protein